MKLVATRPVLYRSTQYKKGDRLPADNQAMVDAWLEAKSAEWIDETKDAPEKVEPKAEAQKPEEPKKAPAEKTAAKKGTKQ